MDISFRYWECQLPGVQGHKRGVTISSAESEYVAVSELVKEIKYVLQLLETLNIMVKLPVKVYIDNMGVIHMARNNISSAATRHVNYRYHYTREVHGRLVKLFYVRSENNESDILTKNAMAQEHAKHSPK